MHTRMTLTHLIFLGLGLLIMAVGGVMSLVAAFRQSLLWGFASLFVPFASFVFLIKHWAEAKQGFFVGLVGMAIFAVPVFIQSDARSGLLGEIQSRMTKQADGTTAPDLTAQIATQRSRIEQLEGQFNQTNAELTKRYQALGTARQALKSSDTAAVTRFNADAAAYQTETTALRQQQQEITLLRQELDKLLAARAKMAASPSGANGRQIIMYSTAQCPACQQAKQYLTQRGVPFEERNVQQSKTAADEFQRLGGRGVPLIMVGGERMEGFNPQEIDRLLAAKG